MNFFKNAAIAIFVMVYMGVGMGLEMFVHRCKPDLELGFLGTAAINFVWPFLLSAAYVDMHGGHDPEAICVWEKGPL